VFAGCTAAWMHGLDCDIVPIEIAVPLTSGVRCREGLHVRHLTFEAGDVTTIKNTPVTALHRTLRDLCVRKPRVEALAVIDMAIRCRRTSKGALRTYVAGVTGRPGAKRLRRLVEVAEPAESPMETRLRWLLLRRGMPRPEVQADLHDKSGSFVGRADLYYRAQRIVVEFDGGNHRDRLVSDDRRQNALVNAGFTVLRYTSADVFQRPAAILTEVRAALLTHEGRRVRSHAVRGE
jgi:very-short-patch-repair endonuclease